MTDDTTCIRREHAYWTTCTCNPCRQDRARKRKLQSLGHTRTVTHNEAWAIIANKFAQGWTGLALASACDLPDDTFKRHLTRWRRGEQCYVGPILATRITNMGQPTRGQIGAQPSRRRLRALATIGHGLRTVSEVSGVNFSTLAAIRNGNERVGAKAANNIAAAYEQLHMTPGTDTQAERIAREKGWPAPLAFDDIDTDPEPTQSSYIPADRATAVAEMVARGDNLTTVCRTLHLSVNTFSKWCGNNGLNATYRVLASREGDWNSRGRSGANNNRYEPGDAA